MRAFVRSILKVNDTNSTTLKSIQDNKRPSYDGLEKIFYDIEKSDKKPRKISIANHSPTNKCSSAASMNYSLPNRSENKTGRRKKKFVIATENTINTTIYQGEKETNSYKTIGAQKSCLSRKPNKKKTQ